MACVFRHEKGLKQIQIKQNNGEVSVVERNEQDKYKMTNSYHLSPRELTEVHKKYGRPGELAPGRPATRKRNRLDETLSALDRKDPRAITPFNGESEFEPDLKS